MSKFLLMVCLGLTVLAFSQLAMLDGEEVKVLAGKDDTITMDHVAQDTRAPASIR